MLKIISGLKIFSRTLPLSNEVLTSVRFLGHHTAQISDLSQNLRLKYFQEFEPRFCQVAIGVFISQSTHVQWSLCIFRTTHI